MTIWQAIEQEKTVVTQDGFECRVVKWKNGRAKVRHYMDDGRVMEAWVSIESLKVKK
jgi:hypothetical protein